MRNDGMYSVAEHQKHPRELTMFLVHAHGIMPVDPLRKLLKTCFDIFPGFRVEICTFDDTRLYHWA